MEEEQKGCVYFFRHVGLDPIKIGYSSNSSPIKRFNQFKTYAPFGAEIIGFIQTDEAKEIETKLHQKYANKRLDGEWFLISEKQCNLEIDFYTSKEDIKLRNDFQIFWAKSLADEQEKNKIDFDIETNSFYNFKKIYLKNKNLNRTYYASVFKVSRRTIVRWIEKIEK